MEENENSDEDAEAFSVVNPLGQEGSSQTLRETTTTSSFLQVELLKYWTKMTGPERGDLLAFQTALADKQLALEREKTIQFKLQIRLAELQQQQQTSVQQQAPTTVQPQGPNVELQTAGIPLAEPYFFERGKYDTFNISLIKYFPNSFFA